MKNYILSAIAAVAVLSGCGKDFLTEAPVLATDNAKSLATVEALDNATGGNYGVLPSTDWYGYEFILMNEMTTANGRKYIGAKGHDSGRLNELYTLNITSGTAAPGLWSAAYALVLGANNVINQIDNVAGDEALKNNLKAENLFLRALAHFDLVRTYARPDAYTKTPETLGVPVVLVSGDFTVKPARDNVKKVYDQVVADLLEAESLIADNYVRGLSDSKASVSKAAIQALLSRVYLYMGKWQESADYATKVINSKAYTLWTVEEAQGARCFRQDVPTGGEIIFEVYGHKTNTNDGFHDSLFSMTAPNGEYGDAGASQDILARYTGDDVRATWFSPDADGNYLFTLKYAGKGLGTPDVNNTVVLRLSEMYLNRAEAAINGATGYNAGNDLAAVASARGSAPESTTINGVLAERAKEFPWEAHLRYDLARHGLPMTRVDVADGIPTRLEADDHRWIFPIAIREFNVNPNLVQNPGYSTK